MTLTLTLTLAAVALALTLVLALTKVSLTLTLTLTLFKGGAADDGPRRAAHGGRGAVATLEDITTVPEP